MIDNIAAKDMDTVLKSEIEALTVRLARIRERLVDGMT